MTKKVYTVVVKLSLPGLVPRLPTAFYWMASETLLIWPRTQASHSLLWMASETLLAWPRTQASHSLLWMASETLLIWPRTQASHSLLWMASETLLIWPRTQASHSLLWMASETLLIWPRTQASHTTHTLLAVIKVGEKSVGEPGTRLWLLFSVNSNVTFDVCSEFWGWAGEGEGQARNCSRGSLSPLTHKWKRGRYCTNLEAFLWKIWIMCYIGNTCIASLNIPSLSIACTHTHRVRLLVIRRPTRRSSTPRPCSGELPEISLVDHRHTRVEMWSNFALRLEGFPTAHTPCSRHSLIHSVR